MKLSYWFFLRTSSYLMENLVFGNGNTFRGNPPPPSKLVYIINTRSYQIYELLFWKQARIQESQNIRTTKTN